MSTLRVLALLGLAVSALAAGAETTDCTVVSSLPAVLPSSGVYCLKSNLNTSMSGGTAIEFGASFIVLDLNGFKLDNTGAGTATLTTGIDTHGFSNATIRNGTVRGFLVGVSLLGSSNHVVEDLRLVSNRRNGVAAFAGTKHALVRNNLIATTGAGPAAAVSGILLEGSAHRVAGNVIFDTTTTQPGGNASAIFVNAEDSVVEHNQIENAQYGVFVGAPNALLLENRIQSATSGLFFQSVASGKYRDTLTMDVVTPYAGGTDAGNNN